MTDLTLSINSGSSSIKWMLLQDRQMILTASLSLSSPPTGPAQLKYKYSPYNKDSADPLSELVRKEISGESSDRSYSQIWEEVLQEILNEKVLGEKGEERIRCVGHRIVHGGVETEPVLIVHGSKGEKETLEKMEELLTLAPLHNYHAMMIVKSCLARFSSDVYTVLCFDTLFHTTIPLSESTYLIPPSSSPNPPPVPLRKFGFHGLSFTSILNQMSDRLEKDKSELNLVVAHLGSGGSVCLIQGGESRNTTMGVTPLEGLPGGTRSGSIDPSLIFHHTENASELIDWNCMKISRGELVLNKESGFQAIAGTNNFGTIIERAFNPSSCTLAESTSAKLAYSVYLSHLTTYISSYLSTLLSSQAPLNRLDGIVFSGGIGEKASKLRADVLASLAWIEDLSGSHGGIDQKLNEAEGAEGEVVRRITKEGSKVVAWVVETSEEQIVAQMTEKRVRDYLMKDLK